MSYYSKILLTVRGNFRFFRDWNWTILSWMVICRDITSSLTRNLETSCSLSLCGLMYKRFVFADKSRVKRWRLPWNIRLHNMQVKPAYPHAWRWYKCAYLMKSLIIRPKINTVHRTWSCGHFIQCFGCKASPFRYYHVVHFHLTYPLRAIKQFLKHTHSVEDQ
jgi:hypothetical protein